MAITSHLDLILFPRASKYVDGRAQGPSKYNGAQKHPQEHPQEHQQEPRSSISRASQKSEEGGDVLAELLGILARGKSQWYTLNGDTNTDISLCKVLGFYSKMDYYALLVSKNLAAYRMNRKTKVMEITIDKLFIQF